MSREQKPVIIHEQVRKNQIKTIVLIAFYIVIIFAICFLYDIVVYYIIQEKDEIKRKINEDKGKQDLYPRQRIVYVKF
jgi:TM2 domain-containing membrane protein YozV